MIQAIAPVATSASTDFASSGRSTAVAVKELLDAVRSTTATAAVQTETATAASSAKAAEVKPVERVQAATTDVATKRAEAADTPRADKTSAPEATADRAPTSKAQSESPTARL